jgi:hypothetical protein
MYENIAVHCENTRGMAVNVMYGRLFRPFDAMNETVVGLVSGDEW